MIAPLPRRALLLSSGAALALLVGCADATVVEGLARVKRFAQTITDKLVKWAAFAPSIVAEIQAENAKIQALVATNWQQATGIALKAFVPLARKAIDLVLKVAPIPVPKIAIDAFLALLDFLANMAGFTSLRPGSRVPTLPEAERAADLLDVMS